MNLGPKKFATRSTFSLSGSEDESDRGQVSTKRIIMLSSTTRTGQHEKKTAAAEQTVLGVVAAASGVGDCVSFRAGNWNRRPIVESESRSNIFSLFIFVWAREEMDGWMDGCCYPRSGPRDADGRRERRDFTCDLAAF